MAILDWKPPPPCQPAKHVLHPHRHAVTMEDGRPKPCSGRWHCLKCRVWVSRKQCPLPDAPKLPAGWLK